MKINRGYNKDVVVITDSGKEFVGFIHQEDYKSISVQLEDDIIVTINKDITNTSIETMGCKVVCNYKESSRIMNFIAMQIDAGQFKFFELPTFNRVSDTVFSRMTTPQEIIAVMKKESGDIKVNSIVTASGKVVYNCEDK